MTYKYKYKVKLLNIGWVNEVGLTLVESAEVDMTLVESAELVLTLVGTKKLTCSGNDVKVENASK